MGGVRGPITPSEYSIYCRATTPCPVSNRIEKCCRIVFFFNELLDVTGMPSIRVLVVDDHELVRRAICSLLSGDPTLDVVCQTADGEQAVAKAEELRPDLVLLDISLPGINGIETGRRIRKVSPDAHVIFLSQHDSTQMVEDALRAGGHGYVAKVDAGAELLEAIRTVREGKKFVSQRILSQGWKPETQDGV